MTTYGIYSKEAREVIEGGFGTPAHALAAKIEWDKEVEPDDLTIVPVCFAHDRWPADACEGCRIDLEELEEKCAQ